MFDALKNDDLIVLDKLTFLHVAKSPSIYACLCAPFIQGRRVLKSDFYCSTDFGFPVRGKDIHIFSVPTLDEATGSW